MTQTQEKRLVELMKKHADLTQEQAEFVVMTGLTFDKVKFEDYKEGNIDWYYPKGAAFNDDDSSESDPTPDPDDDGSSESDPISDPDDDNTQQNVDDAINNPDNNTTVNSSDDQGNTNTEPLDPNSTVTPVTVGDDDDNPDNDPAVGTSDGEIIVSNDEP